MLQVVGRTLKAIDDQINREQKHANVFGEVHDVSILARAFRLQSKICNLIQPCSPKAIQGPH